MILHIIINDKVTVELIRNINQLWDKENHRFYIVFNDSNCCKKEDLPYDNVFWGEMSFKKEFVSIYKKADKVIFHGLFYEIPDLLRILLLTNSKKQKLFWTIWGGDLYDAYRESHNKQNKWNVRLQIKEFFRRRVIKKIYGAITSSDYEILCKWYKTNAIMFEAYNMYQLIDDKEITDNRQVSEGGLGRKRIIIGNSATRECRHLKVFHCIKDYKDEIEIFCPLSYPNDKEYIDEVVTAGVKYFGAHFHALIDFMPYKDYIALLNSMDIAIFDHNRQQANGNIVNMLYLKKKVYISSENTFSKNYRNYGVVLYDTETLKDTLLEEMREEQQLQNKNIIKQIYSPENFYEKWNRIFEA